MFSSAAHLNPQFRNSLKSGIEAGKVEKRLCEGRTSILGEAQVLWSARKRRGFRVRVQAVPCSLGDLAIGLRLFNSLNPQDKRRQEPVRTVCSPVGLITGASPSWSSIPIATHSASDGLCGSLLHHDVRRIVICNIWRGLDSPCLRFSPRSDRCRNHLQCVVG